MERIVVEKISNKDKHKCGFRYTMKCIHCGKLFNILGYMFNQSPTRGKFCSHKCSDTFCENRERASQYAKENFNGVNNPNYKNGWTLYTKERKNYCEVCGITREELTKNRKEPIDVHHKDGNYENCDVLNLVSMCMSCHRSLHKRVKMQVKPRNGQSL